MATTVKLGELHTALNAAKVDGTVASATAVAGLTSTSKLLCVDSPPSVTGKRSDATALADLLTKLAAMGVIVDGTTAS